jgi:hypothetical protein
MTSDPIAEFERLVSEALWFDDHYELDQMPAYGAVLGHIQAHPEHRAEFGRGIFQTLWSGDDHLFLFCMGHLKWPEVQAELRREMDDALSNSDRRKQFGIARALECFDEGYEFP